MDKRKKFKIFRDSSLMFLNNENINMKKITEVENNLKNFVK